MLAMLHGVLESVKRLGNLDSVACNRALELSLIRLQLKMAEPFPRLAAQKRNVHLFVSSSRALMALVSGEQQAIELSHRVGHSYALHSNKWNHSLHM